MPHDIIDHRSRELSPEINNLLADRVRAHVAAVCSFLSGFQAIRPILSPLPWDRGRAKPNVGWAGTGSGKSFAFGIPIVSQALRIRDCVTTAHAPRSSSGRTSPRQQAAGTPC